MTTNVIVTKCPVCLGNGLVPNGFYSATKVEDGCLLWMSGGTNPETCRSCGGSGYIIIKGGEQ